MTLDQLRILVSIADHGGVLAAAAALNRTQPTLSVATRKLEEELGVPLLERDSYRARLTPQGEKICREARKLLRQESYLGDLAAHLAAGHEAQLSLAIEESCPVPLVLQVLKKLEAQFPQTEFELVGERLWGALERLEGHEAQLAITPWFEENVRLESFPLNRGEMLPVAAPGFMPGLAKPLRLAELRAKVQVVVRDSSRNPRKSSLGVLGEGRQWLVNDHQTKKAILLAGMGWGRLQRHMIEQELAEGRLIPLQITDYGDSGAIEIRVARRRDEAIGPVAQALWDELLRLAGFAT